MKQTRKIIFGVCLAAAFLAGLPAAAMAHERTTFIGVTSAADGKRWGTYPGAPCDRNALYVSGANGNIINPEGTFDMTIENGTYTFNLVGSGSATGPVFQLGMAFEDRQFYELLVSYNTATQQFSTNLPSFVVGSITVTLVDFKWNNNTSGQPDYVGACSTSPDGVGDSNGSFTIVVTQTVQMAIDIRPGKFPNTIKLSSGQAIPVAIISTPTISAPELVDPSTVRLAGAPVRTNKPTSVEDVNGDGLLDLIVYIDGSKPMQLTTASTQATLTGKTFPEPGAEPASIVGFDSVKITP